MPTTITLADGRLVVEPVGINKLWRLRRRIEVHLAQVRGAPYDPGAAHAGKRMRAPGLTWPGRKWVGAFSRTGTSATGAARGRPDDRGRARRGRAGRPAVPPP